MNVCGAIPGTLDRSTMGHPGKYTYCVAENEADSPWEPYHVEKGFSSSTSTVTVLPALGPQQVCNSTSNSAEGVLASIASTIVVMGDYALGSNAGSQYCVLVIGGEHRNIIAKQGLTKKQVKEFLHQKAQRSRAELKRWGMMPDVVDGGHDEELVATISDADKIMVLAGGGGGPFSAYIAAWAFGKACKPVTRAITSVRSK